MSVRDSGLSFKSNKHLSSVAVENTVVASLAEEVNELVKNAGSPSNSSYIFQEETADEDKEDSAEKTFMPHVPATIKSINEIMAQYVRTPNDSNDPSYTHLTVPYSVVCRQRYRNAARQQKAYFIKEIKAHELLRTKALDGIRIHREFCNTTIRSVNPNELIRLTRKQKERLEKILSSP